MNTIIGNVLLLLLFIIPREILLSHLRFKDSFDRFVDALIVSAQAFSHLISNLFEKLKTFSIIFLHLFFLLNIFEAEFIIFRNYLFFILLLLIVFSFVSEFFWKPENRHDWTTPLKLLNSLLPEFVNVEHFLSHDFFCMIYFIIIFFFLFIFLFI